MPPAVPIIKQGSHLLIPFQAALSDAELLELRDEMARAVGRHRSRGVVMDVSALDIIDSFACRAFREMAQANGLRGAETVLVGIQPDVAYSMVQLGLSVRDVTTMLDTEEALAYLDQRMRRHG